MPVERELEETCFRTPHRRSTWQEPIACQLRQISTHADGHRRSIRTSHSHSSAQIPLSRFRIYHSAPPMFASCWSIPIPMFCCHSTCLGGQASSTCSRGLDYSIDLKRMFVQYHIRLKILSSIERTRQAPVTIDVVSKGLRRAVRVCFTYRASVCRLGVLSRRSVRLIITSSNKEGGSQTKQVEQPSSGLS